MLFNLSADALQIIKLIAGDFQSKGQYLISQRGSEKENRPKGANVSPYILTNRTGVNIYIVKDFDRTLVLPEEKTYLEVSSLEIEREETQSFTFEIEGFKAAHKVELGQATQKKVYL